jgi:phosphopantothenoylcysteine decarboxylase / phosphopantothenate---cysteine ligase
MPNTPHLSNNPSQADRMPHVLITAGPTHEPIDAVRFIGNRSSGRMGVALAHEAAARGWIVTLLLGPTVVQPTDERVQVVRFRTCAELQGQLRTLTPQADVLIMAAAVADYRPKTSQAMIFGGKFRRKNENLTLELEPTPDLLAEVGAVRRADQLFVGFALEPRDEMLDAATAKMGRKKIDMIVANPLETMDSDMIEATLLYADGRPSTHLPPEFKGKAAAKILDSVGALWRERASIKPTVLLNSQTPTPPLAAQR